MAVHNAYLNKRALPLLLALALTATACSEQPQGQAGGGAGGAPRAMPVTVVQAQPTQVPLTIESVAQTEGAREVEVRARVGGILEERLYEEGARVKEGQPLFRIDPEPLEIALAKARAALAERRAQQQKARRDVERLKGLVEQDAISRMEYEDAVSAAELAEAGVASAEAAVREAELNHSYATVTAPVSGITGEALKSEGSLVAPGAEGLLTTIVQVNPIWVSFSLATSELAQVPGGALTRETVKGVELLLPNGEAYPAKGRLNFAASRIDPRLGTLQLRAEFPNTEGRLLPGQFVRVRLLLGQQEGAFLVPQQAVQQTPQGAFVYVVGPDGTAQNRPVQAGEWRGDKWVILDGLQAGEQVIVDNLIKLRPGAPVAPQPAGAPGQAEQARAEG